MLLTQSSKPRFQMSDIGISPHWRYYPCPMLGTALAACHHTAEVQIGAGVVTFTNKDIGVWSFKKADFIPDGLSMVRNTENFPKDKVVGRVWLSSICDLIWISTIHKLGIPPSSSTCCDNTRFCALLIWLGGQGVSWNGGRDYRWFQFKYPIWGNRVFIKPGSHRWVFLKSCGCQKKHALSACQSATEITIWPGQLWIFSESKDSSPSKRSTMEVTIVTILQIFNGGSHGITSNHRCVSPFFKICRGFYRHRSQAPRPRLGGNNDFNGHATGT